MYLFPTFDNFDSSENGSNCFLPGRNLNSGLSFNSILRI